MRWSPPQLLLPLLICASAAVAAAAAVPDQPRDRGNYGPFQSTTIGRSAFRRAYTNSLVPKAIVVKIGPHAIAFDTDLLRVASAWTEGFIDTSNSMLNQPRGEMNPAIEGIFRFGTAAGPGWARDGSFADPRGPSAAGPLPREWAHYRGLYLHGDRVIFSYSVGSTDVLEMPGSVTVNGHLAFTRTLRLGPTTKPLTVLVCGAEGAKSSVEPIEGGPAADSGPATGNLALLRKFITTAVGAVGERQGATFETTPAGRIHLKFAPSATARTLTLVIGTDGLDDFPILMRLAGSAQPADLTAMCKGGPPRWTSTIVTQGKLAGPSGAAYVVDTLALPAENPWNAWIRPTGIDFFPDGRCAVCTLNGDVWIVSGIDTSLNRLTWRRFATGLYEPLGLRILDGQIYVLGRDQITRLHDLNDDGEADFYENFNNERPAATSYHGFALDLQSDSRGALYYAACGFDVPSTLRGHGALLRVSPDGANLEVVARGLRVPNGLAIGPHDEIFCTDNQGEWTPACRLNAIKPGGFYGFVPHSGTPVAPKSFDPPLCWLPMSTDNSTSQPIWATSQKWGPLGGHILLASYGKCALFHVLAETIDGQAQGGVVRLPLAFDSGLLRGRFNPADGQLYLCGMRGWQTSAAREACLHRVRYTGRPLRLSIEMHVTAAGLSVTFAEPLDPASARDEQNYAAERWTYRWSAAYGSPELSAADPTKEGHDAVPIKSATLSADGKTITLLIPDIRPVMQMRLTMHVKAADGAPISCQIDHTINRVPVK